jgi:transposase InsO family protein
LGYNPNLLMRMSPPALLNRIWIADITYLPLKGTGFAYLASVVDLCSRRVVGWAIDVQMNELLVLDALQHAISARQPSPGLIHHSDRGGQYASHAYRAVLRRADIRQSMSRAANCYGNAFMESCFGTIKTELEMTEYDNCELLEGWIVPKEVKTPRHDNTIDILVGRLFAILPDNWFLRVQNVLETPTNTHPSLK